MEKYTIECPNCKTKFDMKSIFDHWKNKLFEKIDQVVKEIKEERW